MDYFFSTLVGAGIPAAVLKLALDATGLKGAARYTTALAAIGPGGIRGGLCTLGITMIASLFGSKSVMENIMLAVISERQREGASPEKLLDLIDKYPVSSALKARLRESVIKSGNAMAEQGNKEVV